MTTIKISLAQFPLEWGRNTRIAKEFANRNTGLSNNESCTTIFSPKHDASQTTNRKSVLASLAKDYGAFDQDLKADSMNKVIYQQMKSLQFIHHICRMSCLNHSVCCSTDQKLQVINI